MEINGKIYKVKDMKRYSKIFKEEIVEQFLDFNDIFKRKNREKKRYKILYGVYFIYNNNYYYFDCILKSSGTMNIYYFYFGNNVDPLKNTEWREVYNNGYDAFNQFKRILQLYVKKFELS
jgi:cytidylate kinase